MAIPEIRNIGAPLMNLIRLRGFSILQQLHIEEQLLRTSSENWCIVSDGTRDTAIVVGISGKPAELLEIEAVLRDQVPVIRRFTGGGTVIVDHGTIFVTFICNKDVVPGLQPYPKPIMSWSSLLYSKVFQGIGDFRLRENDYVFGNHKFGGNAQSITKNRWIHHTSFLWDYKVKNMAYLRLPKQAPEYRMILRWDTVTISVKRWCNEILSLERNLVADLMRPMLQERSHLDFICRLRDYMPRSTFIEKTVEAAGDHFSLKSLQLEEIEALSSTTAFVPSSKELTDKELEAALIPV